MFHGLVDDRLDVSPSDREFDDPVDHSPIGRGPTGEQFTYFRSVGTICRIQHRQRVDTLADVGTGRFAEEYFVGDEVEDIVRHLEDETHLPCPFRDGFHVVRRGGCCDRTETGRCADQACGLAADHLEVSVGSVVEPS